MKTCGKCRQVLPLSRFHRHGDGHQPWCKECKAAYAAAYYRRTRDSRIEANRRHRERAYEWYFVLKRDRPCADCGGLFHPVAMQWDHRPGTEKVGDVATLQRGRR